jgi:hypothetical protein
MKSIATLTLAAILLAAGTVSAARPANVARTTWTLQINGDIETLTIDTQGGPGAPGPANCRSIRGQVRNIDVSGWYCPSTGRIHFVHGTSTPIWRCECSPATCPTSSPGSRCTWQGQ